MSDLVEKREEMGLEAMPYFDFIFENDTDQEARLAEHRAWLKGIKREKPMPKHPFKVAVYIRYFNQTKYGDYLSFHKQQFLESLRLCPNWEFIGFYIDEGSTAPNMESAEEWSRLLQDCFDGKVGLIITQKTGRAVQAGGNLFHLRGYFHPGFILSGRFERSALYARS